MNKRDTKKLEKIKARLGVKTKAEIAIVEHLFMRDLNRSILLYDYGKIREKDGWVQITAVTNKASYLFSVLASEMEEGNLKDLWYKID